MTGIYTRLGFNSSDPMTANTVSTYSAGVNKQMTIIPPLLKNWQQQDIANSSASGYFMNPVGAIAQQIYTSSSIIASANAHANLYSTTTPSANVQLASSISVANSLLATTNSFIYLTNRQSNIVPIGNDTSTPHYSLAISNGKILSYITNQSDGIQNNSTIMGNFTSITLGDQLLPLQNNLVTLTTEFSSSLMFGVSNTSNMSQTDAANLLYTLTQISNMMVKYYNQDVQFFQNSQSVISDYNSVNQFSNLGQTQTSLLTNYIGTPKLVSRLGAS